MRALTAGLLTIAALLAAGCHSYDWDEYGGREDCRYAGGPAFVSLADDAQNCGACGNVCPEGILCHAGRCLIDTKLNCGAVDRQCVAFGAADVACIEFPDGRAPDGVELVNGYGCVPLETPRVLVPADDEGTAPAETAGPRGPLKRGDVDWLLIAGYSDECATEGVDHRACQTAGIGYADVCDVEYREPLAYDFAIMTREMHRGLFREVVCDCTAPETMRCVDLCLDAKAPGAEKRDLAPMTGLNWCEAYEACRAMGARLPTARERARIEALAAGPRTLFRQATNCSAWAMIGGLAPWLAECLDAPPDTLGLDDTRGEAGKVLFGVGVLTEPVGVHHLIGNVDEWLADPAWALTPEAILFGEDWWGTPETLGEGDAPRVMQGKSVFSPAGQPGDRLIAVEPSVRAGDVGVRCAWTTTSPFDFPVPYDTSIEAGDHANCVDEPSGIRPVRRFDGERVYRAVDVCLDRDADVPDNARGRLEDFASDLLSDTQPPRSFVRRVALGELKSVGAARIAVDEQWWLTEPIAVAGGFLELPLRFFSVELRWLGETDVVSGRCKAEMREQPLSTDGRLLRRHAFILDDGLIGLLGPDGAEFACAHLDCIEPEAEGPACANQCPGWLLPLAIDFERTEPYGRAEFCVDSPRYPDER